MVQSVLLYTNMVQKGQKWSKIVQHGSKWFKIVQNGPKWFYDSKGAIIRLSPYLSVKKLYFSKVIFLKQKHQNGPQSVQIVQNYPK